MHFLKGERRLRVNLHQHGAEVSGRHDSNGFAGDATGQVNGATVRLTLGAPYEANLVTYSLEGAPTGPSALAGSVQFGAVHSSNRGAFNLRQHGAGTWEARRLT